MYDHILTFASEPVARTELAGLGYAASDGNGGWVFDDSCVLRGVSVVLADAVWSYADPNAPVLVTPQQVLPGYWVVISRHAPDDQIKGLANAACRLIADSALGEAGQPFIVWTAPDLNLAVLATVIRIEPTLAGRQYDFSLIGAP